jgi:5-methylcytosine-specific restriction protein A
MPDRIPSIEAVRPTGIDLDSRERAAFYNSARWVKHRKAYLAKHPLCERCRAAGNIKAASVVHHKVDRLDDPSRAWDWTNFEALCKSCHSTHHNATRARS